MTCCSTLLIQLLPHAPGKANYDGLSPWVPVPRENQKLLASGFSLAQLWSLQTFREWTSRLNQSVSLSLREALSFSVSHYLSKTVYNNFESYKRKCKGWEGYETIIISEFCYSFGINHQFKV